MSEPENPYRAPDSELREEIGDAGGSIENTLAGNADLDMQEVMSEAWECVKGIKGIVIVTGIAMVVVTMIVAVVATILVDSPFIVQSLANLLVYPIYAGLFMVCLRQSVGLSVDFAIPFSYFDLFLTILAVAILQTVFISIGMILLILPGIYLAFALSLAIPLHVDKGLGIADSLSTSLQIINKKFFTVALLAIIGMFVIFLSFFTLIGWIWAIPWVLMIYAITYRQLAGAAVTE